MGPPSWLGEWCDAVIAELARRSLGAIEVATANTLEELGVALIRAKSRHLLVIARQPVPQLQTEIGAANRRFVIALSDPRSAISYLMRHPGWDLPTATRTVASGCAAVLSLVAKPGALVLSGRAADDAATAAGAVARHLQLRIGTDEIMAIVIQLERAGLRPGDRDDRPSGAQFSDREEAMVSGALQPYISYLASGGDLEPVVWERELFWIFEDPPATAPMPATRPVDLTGRARVLIYGPHINLPPGSWSANVALGVSAEAAGTKFVVEAYAGGRLAGTHLEPTGAQILEADLLFQIEESFEHPVEIRVLSEQSAVQGRLALGRVTLTRRTDRFRDESFRYLARILKA
jgi:hypothetical protein